MNEPTTKEEALRLLDQLQSKFNITKREINESFAKNVLNDKNTYNTEIRSITVDETIFKIIIHWNAAKRWENKKENYPKKAYRNNKWYVYDSTTWNMESPYYTLKVLSNMLIKSNADAIRDSAFFNYSGWARNNQTTVTYQDNHTDAMELRIYDKKWDKYSIECGFNDYGEINKIFYKNFTYSGYINHPSYSNSFYALGFYPVISYSEK